MDLAVQDMVVNVPLSHATGVRTTHMTCALERMRNPWHKALGKKDHTCNESPTRSGSRTGTTQLVLAMLEGVVSHQSDKRRGVKWIYGKEQGAQSWELHFLSRCGMYSKGDWKNMAPIWHLWAVHNHILICIAESLSQRSALMMEVAVQPLTATSVLSGLMRAIAKTRQSHQLASTVNKPQLYCGNIKAQMSTETTPCGIPLCRLSPVIWSREVTVGEHLRRHRTLALKVPHEQRAAPKGLKLTATANINGMLLCLPSQRNSLDTEIVNHDGKRAKS